jgi:hypothetical protein
MARVTMQHFKASSVPLALPRPFPAPPAGSQRTRTAAPEDAAGGAPLHPRMRTH